jgi:hypothetical protein
LLTLLQSEWRSACIRLKPAEGEPFNGKGMLVARGERLPGEAMTEGSPQRADGDD